MTNKEYVGIVFEDFFLTSITKRRCVWAQSMGRLPQSYSENDTVDYEHALNASNVITIRIVVIFRFVVLLYPFTLSLQPYQFTKKSHLSKYSKTQFLHFALVLGVSISMTIFNTNDAQTVSSIFVRCGDAYR